MTEIKLETIKISEIKEYENNTKIHTEKQIGQIRDSIIEFGYNDPIAIDERNEIIEGHGRLSALKQINSNQDQEIKIIRLTGLSEEQKKAYRIAHNKLNQLTDFDVEKLKIELGVVGIDLSQSIGFEQDELSMLFKLKEVENTNVFEERYKVITVEPPEAPKLKEKEAFYCDKIQDYNKIKDYFYENGKLNTQKLLDLI